jgi:diguanylate cyclase (GGDEF)-like protein
MLAGMVFLTLLYAFSVQTAAALEPVSLSKEQPALAIDEAVERYESEGSVSISTAPDRDGVIRRIQVRSSRDGSEEGEVATRFWAAFALTNPTDEQLDRFIVAPHYRQPDSGIFWPDLGADRILEITPSEGFTLSREASPDADVFLITLDPGATITFVAELNEERLPSLTIWEPDAYEATVNSYTLYHGIVLGIAGLLAVFLTILFVVKGSAMFPATAVMAWATLVYVSVDFGFISRVTGLAGDELQFWRAGAEIFLASGLVIFLVAYLDLNRWNVRFAYVSALWIAALAALFGIALFEPEIAAGIARISFVGTLVFGSGLIAWFIWQGFDRAFMLVPAWALSLLWVTGAIMTAVGDIDNDIIQPALSGGLVLIVMLLGFIVMQHAFVGGSVFHGFISNVERQALALLGAGDSVWDWDVQRDRIHTGPDVAEKLNLPNARLQGPPVKWLEILHPDDRDRFRTTIDTILEHRRGRISQDFQLQTLDGHYRTFSLRARPVIGEGGEVIRCCGTLLDVTDDRVAHERLLHDAVHDNLTGLPNRKLFLDRLASVLRFASGSSRNEAKADENNQLRPTVFIIDIDRFKQVNDTFGMAGGDTILLTLSRRIARTIGEQDTLARLSGDQFGIILASTSEPDAIASFAEELKRAIRAPINYADKEAILTASVGLVTQTARTESAEDLVKNAELAVYQAKRLGGDRIEPFRPAFRVVGTNSLQIEADLRRALERQQIDMLFQPIVSLQDQTIAGFEALMRWNHPRLGQVSPEEFIPLAERTGLIVPLGLYALETAARELARWQSEIRSDLFMSVNISSRQILRQDIINDVAAVMKRHAIAPGTLKLELTESLVMSNPEFARDVLLKLKQLGAGLSMDDFGTGYSSLAYLTRFPFDTIKIDKAFLRGSGDVSSAPVILRSIVTMAHDLDMAVVAEGAEYESDLLELTQLQCEYAQGFLFGKPMTSIEAAQQLTDQRRAAQ